MERKGKKETTSAGGVAPKQQLPACTATFQLARETYEQLQASMGGREGQNVPSGSCQSAWSPFSWPGRCMSSCRQVWGGCKWEGEYGRRRGRRRCQGQLPACTATFQLAREMYQQLRQVDVCLWRHETQKAVT